jgi:hypothetical protein
MIVKIPYSKKINTILRKGKIKQQTKLPISILNLRITIQIHQDIHNKRLIIITVVTIIHN